MGQTAQAPGGNSMSPIPFKHLILLKPLGLLYGSSGRLLSPECLTGRAAEHFPPDSPALAGLLAAQLDRDSVWNLHTAGPFWFDTDVKELMLPAPLTLLQETDAAGKRLSLRRLSWQEGNGILPAGWRPADGRELPRKAPSGGWVALKDWPLMAKDTEVEVHANPWIEVPHLHPRLKDEERVSAGEGALFLEYGIALKSGVSLAYFSSHKVAAGVYRFGGEGHLVQLTLQEVPGNLIDLLKRDLIGAFTLITPGLWGGAKLSIREPIDTTALKGHYPWHRNGQGPGILTDKPQPWRHRLGKGSGEPKPGEPPKRQRFSRGRWAVPAGSCYRVPGDPLRPWPAWPESWFPKEGFSFKQLGTGLALPLL